MPEVANKPDGRGLPHEGLREAGTYLYRLGYDQRAQAIPTFRTTTAVFPRFRRAR